MAEISQITLPSGSTYDIKDTIARSELDNKVDKVSGKQLSTNDYTTTEKNKLAGIAAGAEVNVQSDWNVTDTSSDAFIKNKPTIPTDTWKVYYGTCTTAAATKDKAVTVASDQNFSLRVGAIVGVKFSNTNTYSSTTTSPITLNVNSTGAKNIWYNNTHSGAGNTGTSTNAYGYANRIIYYMYDGTYWVWISHSVDNNSTYTAASAAPKMDGTAAVGTSAKYARQDHVHPTDTSRVPTSRTINGKALSSNITLSASDVGALDSSSSLDATKLTGTVPTASLPSYVDDVLEYTNKASFPATGQTGKIYVDKATNLTYRWSGSAYVQISPSLALGTTSSTAYRGDYGNTAYTHATDSSRLTTATSSGLYKVAATAQGHIASLTAVTKADITALGIPGTDTNTDTKVTQTNTTTSADYRVLFSENANDTTQDAGARKSSKLKFNPSTGNLQATQVNGYTLAAAAGKAVDTTIAASSSSTNLPTSAAVATFVEGKGYITSADIPQGAAASSTTPKMDGTATVGTQTTFARGDHIHPTDTSRAAASHTHSAYVNQNAFSNVKVGSTTIAADTTTDTVQLVAGSNITLTPDATNDKVTIAATDTTYTAATAAPGNVASSSSAGTSTNYARQDHTHGITLATGDSNGQVKIAGSNVSVKGWNTAATYDVETTVANDAKLPTGAAVKSFVEGKGYITTDTNTRRAFYGTCATAAATKDKVVTLSDTTGWELLPGTIVCVKFTYTNTYANATDSPITLNVNGTGAKNIWYNTTHSGAGNTGAATQIYGVANRHYYYMYDGTYWVWINYGVLDGNSNTIPTAYSTTAADTAAKTASCTNYNLLAKSYTILLISTTNTAASALTLNINSKGAKPIYINGSASSSSNHTMPAGSYLVYYDGTNYYIRTDGKITGSITGDAATVGGHTVGVNVPSSAVFTDTQSDWSVTDSSSAAFIKNKPAIESTFTLSLASTAWSSTTTTVNSIPYYTATVTASSLVKEYPTIYCGSSSTLPSKDEKDAFNLINYAIADLANHTITFYAVIKPTINLTIKVIG